MISSIFLPEKIGSYYLFTQKVIGIDVRPHLITASKIAIRGNLRTIEATAQEVLSHSDSRTDALKNVIKQLGPYDKINATIASKYAVFRTIQVPFIEPEKISRIVGFEVEPLLPFSMHEAIIDFIVTKVTHGEQQTAHVMVAAVPKKYIAQELALFTQAELNPDKYIVDAFALFAYFKEIPAYNTLTGPIALVDIDFDATRIVYIVDQQLLAVRTIAQGTSLLMKQQAQEYDISFQQAQEHLHRFGMRPQQSDDADAKNKAIFNTFWQKIGLTLNSFVAQFNPQNPYQHIFLLGDGAEIPGIDTLITQSFSTPCSVFQSNLIAKNTQVQIKNGTALSPAVAASVAVAFPSKIVDRFNLRKEDFKKEDSALFFKQFGALAALCALIISLLIGFYIIQTGKLAREVRNSESKALEVLQEQFTSVTDEIDDLEEGLATAETELKREETKWFAFSNMARTSMLNYLLELTNRIDKERLGFAPEQITIREGAILLKAKVNSFESLKQLEQALRQSKLFKKVEGQNDPDFTMRIELKPIGDR